MSNFAIQKNVPLDAPARDRPCPYPFAEMEIGDSFMVEVTIASLMSERNKVSQWVRRFRRASGLRHFAIATRSCENGFRVWRTS